MNEAAIRKTLDRANKLVFTANYLQIVDGVLNEDDENGVII